MGDRVEWGKVGKVRELWGIRSYGGEAAASSALVGSYPRSVAGLPPFDS